MLKKLKSSNRACFTPIKYPSPTTLLADFRTTVVNSDHPDQPRLLDLAGEAQTEYNRVIASAHKLYHASADFETIGSAHLPRIEQAEAKLQHPPRDSTGSIWTAIIPYVIPHFLQSNSPGPHHQIVGYSEHIRERYLAILAIVNEHCDAIQSFTGDIHSIDTAIGEDMNDYPTRRGEMAKQFSSRFLRWN
ncbi:MAG: hypothetical protein Q9184_004198 [Pyrenodesmia sp. 2 TL-2023]